MERIARRVAIGCLVILAAVLASCISAPAASGDGMDGLATETIEDVTVLDTPTAKITETKPYYVTGDIKITDHVLHKPIVFYMAEGSSITFNEWDCGIHFYLAKSIDGTTVEYYSELCICMEMMDPDFIVRAGYGCISINHDSLYDNCIFDEEKSRYGIKVSPTTGTYFASFFPCGIDFGDLPCESGRLKILDGSVNLINSKGSISLKGIKSAAGLNVVMDNGNGNTISGSGSAGDVVPREGTFRASGALDLTGFSPFEGWLAGSLSDAKYIGHEAVTGYDSLFAYGNTGGGYADDRARVHLRNATFSGLQLGSCHEIATVTGASTSVGGNGISIDRVTIESMELESGSLFLDVGSEFCMYGTPIGSPGSTAKLELGGFSAAQIHDSSVNLDFIADSLEIYGEITVASGARLTVGERLIFDDATLVVKESADLIIEGTTESYGDIQLAGRAFVAGYAGGFTLLPTAEITVTGTAYVELDDLKIPSGPKYNAILYVEEYSYVVLTSFSQAIAEGAKEIHLWGSVPQIGDLTIPEGVSVDSDGSLGIGSLKIGAGASLVVGSSGSGSLDIAGAAVIDKGAAVDVNGSMSAASLSVQGVLTVGGDLSCDCIAVAGTAIVTGDTRPLTGQSGSSLGADASSSLTVYGSLDVKGGLSNDLVIVNGSMGIGGDLDVKSIRVNGDLDVGGEMDIGTFVVEEGHDVDGTISADTMIVPAGVSFVSGRDLDVGDLLVLGTFRAGLTFSAERVLVGMSMTSDDPYVGDSAALIVPEGLTVMGLKALYVAEGSAVQGLADSMASTSYIVDGIAYATGYMPSGGSLKVSDLRVPAFDGTAASGWTYTVGGMEADVGDMLVGEAGEVHATLCDVHVQAGEGFAKVFIDKAEVPVGGEAVRLSPGTHTVSWMMVDGSSGDAVVTFAGIAVSGGSFTVGEGDGGAVLSLTGAEPADDGNWGACAAVLVAIVVLVSAAVGYRALRPRP